jgi:hypothetical protein
MPADPPAPAGGRGLNLLRQRRPDLTASADWLEGDQDLAFEADV